VKSSIYKGEIVHSRSEPVRHSFRYPVYVYGLDLDDLSRLHAKFAWFGYNRIRPVAIHDKDYLVAADGASIHERLLAVLRRHDLDTRVQRVVMVTAARYFHYVFNPVSFFFCYDGEDRIVCHVAEVNNTFRERSIYLLDNPVEPTPGYQHRYIVPKDFYVSPFNDSGGDFDFQFAELNGKLDVRIDVRREGRMVFHSVIRGEGTPLSTPAFLSTVARFPITAAMTMPRIMWQAARLHYQRGLPVVPQPLPTRDTVTRTDRPSLIDRVALRLVMGALGAIRTGQLTLRLPNGEWHRFGDPSSGLTGEIHLRSWRFFRRVALGSDIGFGESYQEGEWDSPDLVAALSVMADNMQVVGWQSRLGSFAIRLQAFVRRLARRNSLTGSRKNIRAHYDLGNEMYEMFLDPTMMYSSAIFEDESEDLESAQKRKIAEIVRKARIEPGHHVLEIGTG